MCVCVCASCIQNSGETPLHMAIRRERGYSLHVIDFLVENSSNIDVVTANGNTALHYCAIYNQPECAKLLLRSGANVNAENKDAKTPLDLAKEFESTACEDLVKKTKKLVILILIIYIF